MPPIAKLDHTGERVQCGRVSCGYEIARIVTVPGEAVWDRDGRGDMVVTQSPARRKLDFGPGWHQRADGRWALTRRAQERRDRGGREVYGRRRPPAGPFERLLGWQRAAGPALPAEAVCPRCRYVNLLGDDLVS